MSCIQGTRVSIGMRMGIHLLLFIVYIFSKLFFLDEEDVHVCGRCKQVFHTLNEYMTHKSSKICKNPSKPTKATSSISPVIPSSNRNHLDTTTKNILPINHQNISDTTPKTVMSVDVQNLMDASNKNVMSLDNQSMLETTVKSVMSISNQSMLNTGPHVISMNNQNILETAAKNTIFRDSFIPVDDNAMSNVDGDINRGIPTTSPPGVVEEEGDRKDKALVLLKMVNDNGVEVVKRSTSFVICFTFLFLVYLTKTSQIYHLCTEYLILCTCVCVCVYACFVVHVHACVCVSGVESQP